MQNSGIWFRNGVEKSNLHLCTVYVLYTEKWDSQENISKPSWGVRKALHFSQAEEPSPELRSGCLYDLNP